jgi:hypothetical protein
MKYYVTKMRGTRFVGVYSLADIREAVIAGRFEATWFATESDGRSFSDFSNSENGNWRTLQTLLAMGPEEIEELVAEAQLSAAKRMASFSKRPSMTPGQKLVVLWWLAAIVAIGVFPPCLNTGSSSVPPHPDGHTFVFNAVEEMLRAGSSGLRVPLIDTGRLHAYWAIVTAMSALVALLIQWSRPPQMNSSSTTGEGSVVEQTGEMQENVNGIHGAEDPG